MVKKSEKNENGKAGHNSNSRTHQSSTQTYSMRVPLDKWNCVRCTSRNCKNILQAQICTCLLTESQHMCITMYRSRGPFLETNYRMNFSLFKPILSSYTTDVAWRRYSLSIKWHDLVQDILKILYFTCLNYCCCIHSLEISFSSTQEDKGQRAYSDTCTRNTNSGSLVSLISNGCLLYVTRLCSISLWFYDRWGPLPVYEHSVPVNKKPSWPSCRNW